MHKKKKGDKGGTWPLKIQKIDLLEGFHVVISFIYVPLTKYNSTKNHFLAKTKLVLDSPRCPLTTLKISAALEKVSFLLFFPLLLILGGLGGLGGSRYAGSPKFWVSIFLVLDWAGTTVCGALGT